MAVYLVTGGAGFIGSHLCATLLDQGNEVRVLDDFSTGKLENLPVDNRSLAVTKGDINDLETVCALLDDVDAVYHLAAVASVEKGMTDWIGTHRTNQTGIITLFEAIRRTAAIPVIYASSAAVYGDAGHLPLSEQQSVRPISAYGADKYGCELHARVAALAHGIPSVGLRFFNVYGPRQDPSSPYSGVISIFCSQILRKEPINIYGDGKQTRDFIYVEDVVNALLAAQWVRTSAAEALICNVCTGVPTSVNELAETIANVVGTRLQVRHLPSRRGDIPVSLGSVDRLRSILGIGEPRSLDYGLNGVIEWLSIILSS